MKKHISVFSLVILLLTSQCGAATLTWKSIPNPYKIKQISVGKRDNVWGVNGDGEIFKLEGGSWKKQDGYASKHIAAGRDGTVWGIGKENRPIKSSSFDLYHYYREEKKCDMGKPAHANAGIAFKNIEGGGWRLMSDHLTQISVKSGSLSWGVYEEPYERKVDKALCVGGRFQYTMERILAPWEKEPRDVVEWATRYHVYQWKPDPRYGGGGYWQKVPGKLKWVSVGIDGSVWGVNSKEEVYERVGNKWKKRSGKLVKIDVLDGGAIFGINRSGILYRRAENKWKKVGNVPSNLPIEDVSVGSQGTGRTKKVGGKMVNVTEVFGYIIDEKSKIWEFSFERYSRLGYAVSELVKKQKEMMVEATKAAKEKALKFTWKSILGELKQISVRSINDIWGVNKANELLERKEEEEGGWKKHEGIKVKQIAVGSDGAKWAIGEDNYLYKCEIVDDRVVLKEAKMERRPLSQISVWKGTNVLAVIGGDVYKLGHFWEGEKISGLKQVSVGADGRVWGLNEANEIFQMIGDKMEKVPGELTNIAVANKDTVLGIDAQGALCRRWGDEWEKVIDAPVNLKQVSVSFKDNVIFGCVIDKDGKVHSFSQTVSK